VKNDWEPTGVWVAARTQGSKGGNKGEGVNGLSSSLVTQKDSAGGRSREKLVRVGEGGQIITNIAGNGSERNSAE